MAFVALPHSRRRAQRTAALLVLAGTLLGTVGYWLATSGVTATSIAPTQGLNATTGLVADVSQLGSTVSCLCDGAAHKQSGVGVSAITIAESYTAKVEVTVAWTDPEDANKVLDNPNAQISFGLYHPVAYTSNDTSKGTCSTRGAVIVPYGSDYYCALLDTGATGSSSVATSGSDQGELLLSKTLLSGFLLPSATAPPSPVACADDGGSSPSNWCTTTGQGTDQLTMFVVASILTPGGVPRGQQAKAGNLDFYVGARPTH